MAARRVDENRVACLFLLLGLIVSLAFVAAIIVLYFVYVI